MPKQAALPQGRSARPRGSYGFDAPRLLAVPIGLVVAEVAQAIFTRSRWSLLGAALIAGCVGLGYHTSRHGKFVVWSRLLSDLRLAGDERILDLGCGRGALLILAARHLTTGRAVGIDIWTADQSGNAVTATLRNAAAEEVADRVSLHTADLTRLPYHDATFDHVVSNVAIHNVKAATAVDHAIDEAVRVLRPGGRLLIADLRYTRRYRRRLVGLRLQQVTRRSLGWRMWWTGPWLPTHLVTAGKPASTSATNNPGN